MQALPIAPPPEPPASGEPSVQTPLMQDCPEAQPEVELHSATPFPPPQAARRTAPSKDPSHHDRIVIESLARRVCTKGEFVSDSRDSAFGQATEERLAIGQTAEW